VIRNLISNAIKYTDENGRITIQSKTIGNEEKISISDSGVGMSEEQIENIFKVDKKYSSPGTAGESGTGLGLIICKDFVERNKGKIFAESTLGRGSQFKFTLPLN
ncbi:histidine kinase-, DNA gyrase B-, and HSP90-like ATPase family protein, partial [Candidatus Magnetomorum sp. HK-1]